MDHNYAKKKLTSLLIDLNSYSADEFRREMARIISGATGQDVPDDCHTIKAERDALAKEVDAANDRNAELVEERDALAAQVADAFGDGYYDGFLDGAKHHEQTDCNTDPQYLGDDAMRCSEIAESEKAARLGMPAKQQCLAEIRASVLDELAAELEEFGPNIGVNYQFVAQRADRVRQGGAE